jgi:hypothetical protein
VWKGDEYRATRITIDLDDDEILLDGKVSGTITDDEESESSPQEDADSESSNEEPFEDDSDGP